MPPSAINCPAAPPIQTEDLESMSPALQRYLLGIIKTRERNNC